MDHRYIEKNNIADGYVLGKLSAAERARFEEHYIDCQECLDRLEFAEVFCRAIGQASEENPAPASAAWGAGIYRYLAQLSPRWQTALFASLILLFAALLGVVAVQVAENHRLHQEIASASAALRLQSGHPPATTGQASSNAGPGTTTSPTSEPSPTVSPLGPARVEPIEKLRGLLQPQINIPIFTLNAVRSADQNPSTPANEIEAPNSPQWLIFSIELDDKPKYPTYRATIFTANGHQLWSASGLQPNRYDAFTLSFPSTFFQPQNYSLVLEGNTPDGQWATAANYSFRVTRKNH
jgi:hypothetical protein